MDIRIVLFAVVALCVSVSACSGASDKREKAEARAWAEKPRFSFVYDGRRSDELLGEWKQSKTTKKLDSKRSRTTFIWADKTTGLEVSCVMVSYTDFPTIEWTLHFKNTGSSDTPIIENIQALDAGFQRANDAAKGEFILHHSVGSPCARNDFQPLKDTLAPNTEKRIGALGGRPTNSDMSYFNIEWQGQGAIIAVGWPGQWSAGFKRDENNGLRVVAGQELTHFVLHPGEEVRSPLIAMQFWTGDHIKSQNTWRRWMLAHNVPKPGGKLPRPEMFGCSAHFTGEMTLANEKNQIEWIDRYVEEGIKIGHYWMDAGWYPCDEAGWAKTGTWEVDKRRFPNGLRAISDHASSNGIKTILWFEPERVHPGTWLTDTHPEWILGGKNGGLLNLGNPVALAWLTEHVDKLLRDEGIDIYRQDFNMDPLDYWRKADTPDRQGITEIKHVTGYLAYWDALLRRHPNMFIDSCASGGRRNDLETMRRAIPLWRTDYRCEAIGSQCHSYGLAFWLPYSGTGVSEPDAYNFRSNMVPFTNCLVDIRNKSLDFASLKRLSSQIPEIADNWLGDYYPLTPYSTEDNVWIAWQFDRPEAGQGMVQAFRRPNAVDKTNRLKLFELYTKARYSVRDLDEEKSTTFTGRELMEAGLEVSIHDKPGAVVITYKVVK